MRKQSIILLIVLLLTGVAVPVYAADSIKANGEFTATVDFTTLTLAPVGVNCLLEVDGNLVFSGTLEGIAIGTTKALVFASCEDVAVNPPGTFKDVFRSRLEFLGTVNGEPATAEAAERSCGEGGLQKSSAIGIGLRGACGHGIGSGEGPSLSAT